MLGGRRNRAATGDSLPVDETLPVQEKEKAVAPQRSARGAAELVLPERFDVAEKIARVKNIVAEKLGQRTVNLVAAGFGDDTCIRAR